MDAAAIRSARAALRQRLAVLSEARRRLMEAEAQSAHAGGVARPSTAGDDGGGGQLAGAGVLAAAEFPCDDVGSLLDAEPMAAEQETPDDDFYQLDDIGYIEEASSGDRGGMLVDPELDDDDDGFAECMRRIRQAATAGRLRVDPPSAGADQLAGVAGVRRNAGLRNDVQAPITDPSYDDGDTLHHDTTNSMDSEQDPDDFYPLDVVVDEPADDAMLPMQLVVQQWMRNLFDAADPDEDDQSTFHEVLHVPHIQSTPMAELVEAQSGGNFGAVPASAAAIAGLEKQRYQSSDSRCAICMEDYEAGSKLSVMPCEHKHRFHSECLAEWLARSHLCPLCRHALPTEEQGVQTSPRVHGDANF